MLHLVILLDPQDILSTAQELPQKKMGTTMKEIGMERTKLREEQKWFQIETAKPARPIRKPNKSAEAIQSSQKG